MYNTNFTTHFFCILQASTVVSFELSQICAPESRDTVEVCAFVYEPSQSLLTEEFFVNITTQDGRASM